LDLIYRSSSFTRVSRNVTAQGFFGEIIAGGFISPRAAAAADPFEFAGIAFARQFIIVAQVSEDFGMIPDLGEGLLPHVAAIGCQKTAWLYISAVGYEAEPDSPQTTAGYGIQAMGLKRN
jgi:hypothetical protein